MPILKWKLKAGLEPNLKVGRLFTNYGVEYENLTIEEEEWCRLLKKRDKAIGWNHVEHKQSSPSHYTESELVKMKNES